MQLWTGDTQCKDIVLDVADHLVHPQLPSKMLQCICHVIPVPDQCYGVHIMALYATAPAAICIHGLMEVAPCQKTEHEATGDTTSVFPLPTVNEDRGPKKDSDEDHLDGIFHALHPSAPFSWSAVGHPQPLLHTIGVVIVIPGDRRQGLGMLQKTKRPPKVQGGP